MILGVLGSLILVIFLYFSDLINYLSSDNQVNILLVAPGLTAWFLVLSLITISVIMPLCAYHFTRSLKNALKVFVLQFLFTVMIGIIVESVVLGQYFFIGVLIILALVSIPMFVFLPASKIISISSTVVLAAAGVFVLTTNYIFLGDRYYFGAFEAAIFSVILIFSLLFMPMIAYRYDRSLVAAIKVLILQICFFLLLVLLLILRDLQSF